MVNGIVIRARYRASYELCIEQYDASAFFPTHVKLARGGKCESGCQSRSDSSRDQRRALVSGNDEVTGVAVLPLTETPTGMALAPKTKPSQVRGLWVQRPPARRRTDLITTERFGLFLNRQAAADCRAPHFRRASTTHRTVSSSMFGAIPGVREVALSTDTKLRKPVKRLAPALHARIFT